MTREEIEQAIEKGESVWVVDKDLKRVIPYNANRIIVNNFNADALGYNFEDLYKTKAEAEHYLHHANITRTETLPFLTWEEFLEKEYIEFFNGGKGFRLYISHAHNENIRIITFNRYNPDSDVIFEIPQTEANFYKAYSECVRLFKGGE